jgi:copper chaperone CopZ
MKTFVAFAALLFLSFALESQGADKNALYLYDGKISGLYCNACAAKVQAALRKLEGVGRVKITSSEDHGVQLLRIESSSAAITKEAAVRALGEDAKAFTILSLERREKAPSSSSKTSS